MLESADSAFKPHPSEPPCSASLLGVKRSPAPPGKPFEMIYLETSVVVAVLTPEEYSPVALDWFGQCRDSLISRAVRWPWACNRRARTSSPPGAAIL